MAVNAPEYAEVKRLFLAWRDLTADERSARTRALRGTSPRVLEQVKLLLRSHDRMETGALCLEDTPDPPAHIGGYQIVGVLGQGGMGIVYEAKQRSTDRVVALKVVRSGPLHDDLTRRFVEREVAALARLNHPNIASIHSAGVDGAWHYFSMEKVAGKPLTQFVSEHACSFTERLQIFAGICAGVSHAHQAGVIHRDLKPTNILVLPDRTPKILDFGLAGILDADQSVAHSLTQRTGLMGTLAYMSPEQASGGTATIDTRSDIYSLGVILYELLTGRLPLDLGAKPLPEALRIVAEEPSERPSRFNPTLRGDLETIILKTLDKQPLRRYQSANQLADDLRRYTNKQPITAVAPTAFYQMRKLIHRYPAVATLSAVLIVALLAGIVGTTWQAIRAMRAERLAEARQRVAERARAVAEEQSAYAQTALSAISSLIVEQQPFRRQGAEFDPVAFLLKVNKWASNSLNRFPVRQFELRYRIASTLGQLEEWEAARSIARDAAQRVATAMEDHAPYAARAALVESIALRELGRYQEAYECIEPHAERFLSDRAQGVPRLVLRQFARHWPVLLMRLGRGEEAEQVARELLLSIADSDDGETAEAQADMHSFLGGYLLQNGRFEEAVPHAKAAFEYRREETGPDDPDTLNSALNYAICLGATGDAAGIELLRDTLARTERVRGAHSAAAALVHRNLASFLSTADPPAALEHATRATEIFRKRLPQSHPLRKRTEQLQKDLSTR